MKNEKMKERCTEVSAIMKAVAHPQRLMMLCYLAEGEKSVSELLNVCDISQSQISQFLNRMLGEKLLKVRKDGQFSYYSIADKNVVKLIQSLHNIFCNF